MNRWTSTTGKTLRLVQGDITHVNVDAIVNAANAELAGGGGVDGAIHRAAGPSVMKELDRIRAKVRRCPPGRAVVTNAGRLKARYIIHAVGPVYRGGAEGEAEVLASCYRESLQLAAELSLRSIAMPAISAGAYGYPMGEAAEIAIRETKACLENPGTLEEAMFVLFDAPALQAFGLALDRGNSGPVAPGMRD